MRSLWILARAALALAVVACLCRCAAVNRVDAHGRFKSDGRHDGGLMLGPKIHFRDGGELRALAGYQFPIYAPGEPQRSSRASSREPLIQIDYSRPIWRKR